MSELVAKTNVPKSTILYYIKEGLLPEPIKVKANVHKYNDEHVEIIRYIKYMQETMGSSIEQIKLILQNKNNSFSSSYTMLAPLMNTLSCLGPQSRHYTKEEFIEHFEIDPKLLEKLLKEGILIPLEENDFTEKEAAIINLVEEFLEVGVEYTILKEYLRHAQALSKLELEMQRKLCDVKTEENFSILWKIVFQTLFTAKEYLFNRTTYKTFYKAIKEEIVT